MTAGTVCLGLQIKEFKMQYFSDSKDFLTIFITTAGSFKDFTHIHKSLRKKNVQM